MAEDVELRGTVLPCAAHLLHGPQRIKPGCIGCCRCAVAVAVVVVAREPSSQLPSVRLCARAVAHSLGLFLFSVCVCPTDRMCEVNRSESVAGLTRIQLENW